jgi:hypothetical protein
MSFWPFKSKSLLSPEESEWLQSNFDWLESAFGEETSFKNRRLVLPDKNTFRTGGKSGHELAEHVLHQVLELGGISDLNIELHADEPNPEYIGDNLARPVHPDRAAGTYQRTIKNRRIITYDPELLKQPMRLVAVLAHEASHALLDNDRIELPIADELELEFLTDLTAVFLGYGVFMANAAFEYQQFQDGAVSGWSYNRLGYLPQNQLIFSTAIFAQRLKISDEEVEQHLRSGLAATYRRALRELNSHP